MTEKVLVNASNFPMIIPSLRENNGLIGADIETDGLEVTDRIVSLSVYDDSIDKVYYFPFEHAFSSNLSNLVLPTIWGAIQDRNICYHNGAFDWGHLRNEGWARPPDDDSMILAKVANFSNPGALEDLAVYLGIGEKLPSPVNYKNGETFAMISATAAIDYATTDAVLTVKAVKTLKPALTDSTVQIYNLEMKVLPATASMKWNGVAVEPEYLDLIRETMDLDFMEAREILWKAFAEALNQSYEEGADINQYEWSFPPHSYKKLSWMLFEVMGIPTKGVKKTKSGWSTAEKAIAPLAHDYPIIATILRYKTALKTSGMVGTYRDAINPKTGDINANLLQMHVISGRYACSGPNLQQVPKRKELRDGLTFRSAFIARAGKYLLDIDFTQVELCIFAVLAGAEALVDAIRDRKDLHRRTASIVFAVPENLVTEEQRDMAKTVGFGLIYGMTAAGLAQRLGITKTEAEKIMDQFFSAIPEFSRFVQATHSYVKQNLGIFTQYGRWVPIPNANVRQRWEQQKALRLSINAKIQGTAADVMKIAICKVHQAIADLPFYKMLLTVHDELLFEVDESIHPTEAASFLQGLMAQEFGPITIVTDAKWGLNWGDLKPVWDEATPSPIDMVDAFVLDGALAQEMEAVSDLQYVIDEFVMSEGLQVILAYGEKLVPLEGKFLNEEAAEFLDRAQMGDLYSIKSVSSSSLEQRAILN